MSSTDPFDDLLELENDFYKEGYDAGVADSEYAGLIEGKVFGIERGYEKAIDLGRLQGRALIWEQRLQKGQVDGDTSVLSGAKVSRAFIAKDLPSLPDNARLRKHVDMLVSLTDPATIPKDNSDRAVTEVDERITKVKARAKMISAMVGEAINSGSISGAGIEESTGLSARH